MDQSNLKPPAGAKHKKKRVGCGDGSGHGTFSTRGCKGQKSRSGRDLRPGFEGGQLPIIKRLPWTRGFTNVAKIQYSLVNVGELKKFDADSEVDVTKLVQSGLIKSAALPVKILGNGELDRALTVKASKFSGAARSKIEAAGGKVEEI
ncbi:MAG: 50S ribosomal protein L15 [Dehalococcoidia bacterium]|nr:50S ribosomal protein L15 [Dehalococcoidia bacterium]MDD5647310.1 50S ribosomal protein L15 [Dehalococcoidia bacterium]